MASCNGASSGSSLLQNSGSEEDLMNLMDQRKRKRMISNRESARRSRMRKQKHVDDLRAQMGQLRGENQQIMTSISITTQHYMSVEADNSVLRAQVCELSHRLESLNEIIALFSINTNHGGVEEKEEEEKDCFYSSTEYGSSYFMMNPLNMVQYSN